jgi:dihydroorotate dehydrogenase electron transfer subunit
VTLVLQRWTQVTASVAAHADYGGEHRWLDLEVPDAFDAPEPGQFVQLLLEPPTPVLLPRPMSVAAVKKSRAGRVLGFLYAPVGTGTRALARLGRGDRVEVLGPLGHGFPLETPGTPVLVAGGRGVAPLLFAAERLARNGRASRFLFGARTKAQLVGLDDARARLSRARGTLHLATEDGSAGSRGTVLDLLDELAGGWGHALAIHACGPHGMLAALARWAMPRGVPAFLAMESVMACGTGVCRGCPLPRSTESRTAFDPDRTPSLQGNREFAMCCTEGPVFEARTLDWDRVE